MKKLNDNDLEKIYFGWLGKTIGIRYGAPVEMWEYVQIREKYAGKEGYFVDYNDFAADDDSNGPVFFYRALRDCPDLSRYGYADLAECWLNYVPYQHGFYWWGGYGVSEEHTAYLNLQKGILPPMSGSILQNGRTMAEQIGGQIFSDVWGLVSPYDQRRAADLAEMAARVSHDGVAADGGRFVAAMISAAFGAKSVEEILLAGLSVIPKESGYAKTVRDLMRFYREGGAQEACFDYIRANYWKDRYGGNCHIIPNAAIMVYALLYGEGDFLRTLKIANFSGFDTDCNVGNLGTVMGVFTSLEGVDYDTWIAPVRDTTLCSSVLGYANIVNIPNFAYDMFRSALRLRGETYEGKYASSLRFGADEMRVDFALPRSVSGMRADADARISPADGALKIVSADGREGKVFYKTYYRKEDLYDNRYDPAFSPKAYNGQTIRARYRTAGGARVRLFCEDLHGGKTYFSEEGATEWKIEVAKTALIGKIGLAVRTEEGGEVRLEELSCTGKPDYEIDFSSEETEAYSLEHTEVRQCTHYDGVWTLEEGKLTGRCLGNGQLYTSLPMKDLSFAAEMTPASGGDFGILFRVRGARRHYRLAYEGGKLRLVRVYGGETLLAEREATPPSGKPCRISVTARGKEISAAVDGEIMFVCTDEEAITDGCVGAYVGNGSVVRFGRFEIKEL